jgi:hypothetical protein
MGSEARKVVTEVVADKVPVTNKRYGSFFLRGFSVISAITLGSGSVLDG